MADAKISALTAASVAALANELAINEAGTSKKLTLQQALDGIDLLAASAAHAGANKLALTQTAVAKAFTLTQLITYLQTLGMPIVKQLGSLQQTTSTTFAKVTGLDQVLGVGTWMFDYRVQWRTTATATAIKLAVNHTGTAARFLVQATGFEATINASSGAQTAIHNAFGLRAGGQNNVISASTIIFGPITAAVADADLLVSIEGLIAVTVSGNLELYFGADATNTGTQSIEAMTSLVCVRTA